MSLTDVSGIFTNQKCFFIVGNHLKFLVAWLNSKIFRIFAEHHFPKLQKNGRELSKIYFETVQVPIPNTAQTKTVEQLVDQVIYATSTGSILFEYESSINQYFYNLYGLTRSEVELIESFP